MSSSQSRSIQFPVRSLSGAALFWRALIARSARSRLTRTALAVVAVVAIAPYLIPSTLIAPRIERLVSDRLREPVGIASARLHALPRPHVTLHDIVIGRRPYLSVERLSVTPRIGAILSERKILRSIELQGVIVRQPLFERIERWTARGDGPALQVERIRLRGTDLKLNSADLNGIDADVRLAPGNVVSSMLVWIEGGRVTLSLTPAGEGYAVNLSARNWPVPATGLTVASLDANGRLTADSLDLPSVGGVVYGGSLVGQLSLSWKSGWKLVGQLGLRDADLKPIAAVYSQRSAISGRLDAAAAMDMRAENAAAMAAAPNIAVDFEVRNGVLHGIDLVAAARLLPGKKEPDPGDTRFDRFSGHLLVDAEGFHFSGLKIASGVMDAEGFLTISPRKELAGRIEAAVRGTGSLVGTPLAVSGTVDSPRVLPTKGTLAGAAAGTLLLGPVVGTTVGMKAAQMAERLFGRKPPQAKEQPVRSGAAGTQPDLSGAPRKTEVEAQPGRR